MNAQQQLYAIKTAHSRGTLGTTVDENPKRLRSSADRPSNLTDKLPKRLTDTTT